jgi:hypothetical protein
MTTEEFNQLEKLLEKLQGHLGYKYSIASGHHDSYWIGLHDQESGALIKQEISESIETTVNRLKP